MTSSSSRGEGGYAVIVAMMGLLMMSALGAALLLSSSVETATARNFRDAAGAAYAAEALAIHAIHELSQLSEWRAMGLDLHVAVNLAVQNLLDLRTPRQVADLLDRHALPAQALTLEVTESLMLHDPQRAGEVLADLADLGLGLALDDFGTGYSSLEHLKRLPVNELKIDKSFVMTMDRDAADRAIVASTSALGRSLGLRVVAEGVESAASGSVLAAIGCDLAQGFITPRRSRRTRFRGLCTRRGKPASASRTLPAVDYLLLLVVISTIVGLH